MRDEQAIKDGRRALRDFLAGDKGRNALLWLRSMTVEVALGPEASEAELRFREAQRALVKQLERLADETEAATEGEAND